MMMADGGKGREGKGREGKGGRGKIGDDVLGRMKALLDWEAFVLIDTWIFGSWRLGTSVLA